MSTVNDNENQQTGTAGAPGQPGGPGGAASAINPGANTDTSNSAEADGGNGGAGGAGNVSIPSGGAGGAGGDAVASVTTTNPSASATSASVTAAGGTGGPGAAPAAGGTWGAGGVAGTAGVGATDTNTLGDATATARVFGGAGGSGFSGQTGGVPRGYAIANGLSAYATFNLMGGTGGAAYGPGPGGAGAGVTITAASQGAIANASGTSPGDDNARAMLFAEGGNGGVALARGTGDGGDGGSVTLINAVGGTAVSGGNLTLIAHGAGGTGGDSLDGAGGAFGSAETDLSYLGFGTGLLDANVEASGGVPSESNFPGSNSGIGLTAGGAGGNAVANESLSGSGPVDGLAQAFGSAGGASQGTGAIGGSATATGTVATTATFANTSTITVSGDGGSGGAGGDAATNTSGDGGAAGDVKNVSAVASGVGPTFAAGVANPGQAPAVTATANVIQQGSGGAGAGDGTGGRGSGVDAISAQATISGTGLATATVNASGGAGGYVVGLKNGAGNGTGGAGAPITLNNAASGSTYLGWLFLNQTARGGAGGNGPTDTFDSTPLPLGGAAGAAGTATSTVNLTGASANTTSLGLTTNVQAYGGAGGNAGGNGGAGANGTANDTADGIYSVVLSTRALGGAGGTAGTGMGGAGGGAYATGDATAAPGTATVPMPANPGAYLFNGAGRVTPIAQSYVFALGGSGGHSTGPDGMGGVGGNATATSTATGIGGTEGENAYASAIGGAGGAGTTAGTPGNATADATANAQKSGGTALAHGIASGGSASGTTSALTAGGLLALATVSTTGDSGVATASATTNGGFITNAVATATAPSSTATSEAIATAWNQGAPEVPNGQLGGQGEGLVSYGLEAPEVDQSNHFRNSVSGAALGMGVLGGSYAAGGTGAQVFTSSITLDVAAAQVAAGSLEFFLNNPQYTGGAFDSLTFEVTVQGGPGIDRSFTSGAAADAFFSNDLINLGAIPAGGGTLAVTVSLSETLASGNDYGINFSVGDVGGPPPTITGTVAGQRTTNTNPVSPFSQVVVADPNVNQTETVTVTLSDPANGALSNTGAGNFNAATGVYTVSGGAAAVTTALDGLVFTPSAPDVPAGQSETTGFDIKVIDSSNASADDDTTTVVDTAVAGPPAISGTVAGQATSDTAAISPFANVTITDQNFDQTETVTVSLSAAADGALSNLGGGSYNASTGVYSVTGSAAAVSAALDGLLFTPAAHQVAPGQTVTTGFTIADIDTSGLSASDGTTSVIVTTGTALPTIGGTVAGQATSDDTTISPLANVTIGDLNFGQTETVTVTLSAIANGGLSNLGSGSYDAATGVYTDVGSAAAVTATLDGLVFTPTARQMPPGQTVTTSFTIEDTDTVGVSASDGTTTVIATAETPRTLVWTGSAGTNFASAADWDDTTLRKNPATLPPGQADAVQFEGASGGITGSGTAWSVAFDGGGAWQLGSGALLSTSGSVTVGSAQNAVLAIGAGATLVAAGDAVIAATAGANNASVDVAGAGSSWRVGGSVIVGSGGAGGLQIGGGATVTAGALDAGVSAAAVGQIGVTGSGSELTVAGAATVADDGTGALSVLNGATFAADSLTIGSGSDSSGAVFVSGDGSVVQLSGDLNVGTALGTGDLTVGPGAAVHASVVDLQGQVVLEGGLLDPTVQLINQGQTVGGFGTIAAGDIVDEGVIQAGANKASQKLLLVQGNLLGGGTLTVNGSQPGSNPAGILQINAGGTMELTGAVLNAATTTFTDNLTPTGTYTVNNSVVDVTFADAAGVLKLDDIAGFAGTITTFHAGDSFVITGGTLSNPTVVNGNTLTFADSGAGAGAGGIDSIIFAAPVSAAGFNVVNNTVQVACFAAGTLIETATGPVAVEALRKGDRVITADSGHAEPIVWIGQRTVHCARHPRPETVWPVRVRAGAFGENVPVRDLYLSPDHAIFVNGVLVPVKLLIDGTSITREKWDRVTYFHVQLPRHAVILAEGLTVESYLDLGDRASFDDGGTMRLFPDFAARLAPDAALRWETRGAAALVVIGPRLAAAREVVAANAWRCPARLRGRAA